MATSERIDLVALGRIISEVADIPAQFVVPDVTFVDLGIDSFLFVEIIDLIEDRYGFEVVDESYLRSNKMARVAAALEDLNSAERAHGRVLEPIEGEET